MVHEPKQAPQAWYTTLKIAIFFYLGLHTSQADPSLFIYNQGPIICYLLVYVDDLVFIGTHSPFVASTIKQLGDKFPLKIWDNYFVFTTLFFSQSWSCSYLGWSFSLSTLVCSWSLKQHQLLWSKDISTPLSTTQPLCLIDGTSSVDSSEFCRIIASLQYLSLTRSDISFAIGKLSQFMHKSTQNH